MFSSDSFEKISGASAGAYKDLVWLDTTRSFGDIRLKAPHNIVTWK